LRAAAVFLCLFAEIIFEQYLWDETMTESTNTVTAFEIEEAGLSAVLSDAIRDQREVVEFLEKQADGHRAGWFAMRSEGMYRDAEAKLPYLAKAEALHFQALTVLGLLEATREREAGGMA